MERHSKQVAPVIPNVIGVIVARQNSRRLHHKCLQRIADTTLIEFEYKRVTQAATLKEVWIATTIKSTMIHEICRKNNILWYAGSEDDVLSRLPTVADWSKADILVKFTADSPLIDARHIDNIVKRFLQDDASFGFLKGFPKGMYFNMCRVGALRDLVKKISVEDRAIWNQLNETWVWFKYGFTIRCYEAPYDFSDINLEVNDRYDMERVRSIVIGEGDI